MERICKECKGVGNLIQVVYVECPDCCSKNEHCGTCDGERTVQQAIPNSCENCKGTGFVRPHERACDSSDCFVQ
jgi:DnaJ-class molecular chaperone